MERKIKLLLIAAALIILMSAAVVLYPIPERTRLLKPDEQFIANTLATTKMVWKKLIPGYQPVHFKIYNNNAVPEACSDLPDNADPFYCVDDSIIYFNFNTYITYERLFPSRGNFAIAFIVAHEVAHHVQQFNGDYKWFSEQLQHATYSIDSADCKRQLELQADFLAGVWTQRLQELKNVVKIDAGDIEEGLALAGILGDIVQPSGTTAPEAANHGSPDQRMYWFNKGYETGDLNKGIILP